MEKGHQLPLTKVLLNLLASSSKATADLYTMLYDLRFHRGAYLKEGHAYVQEFKRLHSAQATKRALYQLR